MRKIAKVVCSTLAVVSICGFIGCKTKTDTGAIKLTIWVSEADKAFTAQVVQEFKAKYPEKDYQIVIDIQGENDAATRILNDVENAADVYSCLNDQVSKLINGDALARIAGERLNRVSAVNSKEAMESDPEIRSKRKRMEQIRKNPYYNALQVKYGYAITCHKAQGGEWKRVFIDQGYISEDMISPDYYRWLYTAFTRASEKLHLVNWKI